MGITAIEAKKAELTRKCEVKNAFVRAAADLKKELAAIDKGLRELDAARARIEKDVSGLDTLGVKEFVDYKASLMAISQGSSQHFMQLTKAFTRPLPTAPLEAAVKRSQEEVNKMMNDWIEKQTATFPKPLKVNMVFKRRAGELVRLTEFDEHGARCTLKIYTENGPTREQTLPVGMISPQYGYKFVKL